MKTTDIGGRAGHRRRALTTSVVAGAFLATSAVGLTTGAQAYPTQGTVNLGTATPFGVLGGSAVTNTGPTIINGDLGVSPGTSITGFPPGIVNGTTHATDAVATQAEADTTTAYKNAAGRAPDQNLTGTDLGGLTLDSGVYKFSSSAGLTGDLTLDGQGNPDAVFIFQIGSTLTTASASNVNLINGAQACHVFWQVGSSATLGTTTNFVGNVLAYTSVTANTGATVNGRLLAQNGAVTMDTNTVTRSTCAAAQTDITVNKTANPTSKPAPGGDFTFHVSVTNNGSLPVTLSTLTDSVYGNLNGRGTCDTGGSIAVGGTYTCQFTGRFTGTAGASETDRVTASVSDGDTTTTGSDTATVHLTKPAGTGGGNTGYLEICKQASGPGVHGLFTFTVGSHTVQVPVGACSPAIKLPAGKASITEHKKAGYELAACQARPASRRLSCNHRTQTETVLIKAGGIAAQTVAVFINKVPTVPSGALKLCKVAGAGVKVGTRIHFTVGGHSVTVPAGPAPGGYCVRAGRFPLGSHVSVTEHIPAGQHVSKISASPVSRLLSSNLATGKSVVDIQKGFVDLTYTDRT